MVPLISALSALSSSSLAGPSGRLVAMYLANTSGSAGLVPSISSSNVILIFIRRAISEFCDSVIGVWSTAIVIAGDIRCRQIISQKKSPNTA